MKLLTASQTRELDNYAIHSLQIPSTLLMTNAASHIAEAALSLLPCGGCAAVFCGSGNNGGDGIAAAAALCKQGIQIRVFLTGSRARMTPDTLEMERRLVEYGGTVEDFSPGDSEILDYVNHCDVIIDAIFGFGLNASIRGNALAAIALINASPAKVVAADIPSGIGTDTGRILGAAVRADVTVTFSAAKPGHFIEQGAVHCGKLLVTGIGIPPEAVAAAPSSTFSVAETDVRLPRRPRISHKGNYGKVLILAGSVGYTGAPSLAAAAAVRAGAGLVFLGVPSEIYAVTAVKSLEAMPFPLPDEAGKLTQSAFDGIWEKLTACDVCLLGPGLGRSPGVDALVHRILRESTVPLILDADGINALAGNIDILDEANAPVILTPHEGEFSRLGGDLSGDRLTAARTFAAAHRCTLILKGHRTITALPDGRAYINTSGNPGMARGGSGDVLAGILAAFVGQALPPQDAVFLHGAAGDLCAARWGEYAMTPSDMIAQLGEVMKKLTMR